MWIPDLNKRIPRQPQSFGSPSLIKAVLVAVTEDRMNVGEKGYLKIQDKRTHTQQIPVRSRKRYNKIGVISKLCIHLLTVPVKVPLVCMWENRGA